ncbi:MAG: cobalamin-binding protein [Chloroflexi bacterium]|nr:cobalamin-binding protein [Chloroflexota bacterium]
MRIVSLVPAATEIVYALGRGDDLVAATHDSDHPASALDLPRITSSTIPEGSSIAEIDRLVREAAAQGGSTFHLDAGALAAAKPDLLLGQTICAVCAVTVGQLPGGVPVVPLDGDSLEGVLADIARVGDSLGARLETDELLRSLRARLERVADAVRGLERPRVACLEWLDPLFNAGHWVPEQVRIAGGVDVLASPGKRSVEVSWDDVLRAAPEILIAMPCGFDASRAVEDSVALRARPGWDDLAAVRARRAYAVDGNAYFSRPGPRVVDGVELLASLFHPGRVAAPSGSTVLPIA